MCKEENKSEEMKYRLAEAVKVCMKTTSVEKITVKEIVDACGTTRQTFYRHFQDKYDLVEWIFSEDIVSEVDRLLQHGMQQEAIKFLFTGIHKNRKFYAKMLQVSGQNSLEEVLVRRLEELFRRVRERIPGVVLRTSLITGLPYEDEAAFEELCDFLGEQKLQRVGAFPYSPEEGTPAAKMLNRVDTEEAQRRAELVMEIQTQVMDEFNDSRMGDTVEVLCDGWDGQSMSYVGRSYAESPGIDGSIYFTSDSPVEAGDFVRVRITGAMDGELTGERTEE